MNNDMQREGARRREAMRELIKVETLGERVRRERAAEIEAQGK